MHGSNESFVLIGTGSGVVLNVTIGGPALFLVYGTPES